MGKDLENLCALLSRIDSDRRTYKCQPMARAQLTSTGQRYTPYLKSENSQARLVNSLF